MQGCGVHRVWGLRIPALFSLRYISEKMSLFPYLYFSDADFTAKGGHVRRRIVRINDCFFS
jgi:hypothetical protein